MPPPSRRLYRGYPVLHPAAGRKLFDIDAAHDASCHPAEADDQRSLLADGREYPGFGVTRDVAGDGKGAVGARALRVHHAFGDALAVEVRVLLEELPILDEERAGPEDLRSGRSGCRSAQRYSCGRREGRFLRCVSHFCLLLTLGFAGCGSLDALETTASASRCRCKGRSTPTAFGAASSYLAASAVPVRVLSRDRCH